MNYGGGGKSLNVEERLKKVKVKMNFKNVAKYFGHIDQQISCAGRKLSSGYDDIKIDFS